MAWSIFKKLLLVHLAVLSLCTLITAADHRKRHVPSNHYVQAQATYDSQKSTSSEFTTKSEQTVNHGFMGGHLKAETPMHNTEREDDEAKWDDGLFLSSAGNGKEKKPSRDEDDDKKTLSQQVKEGKYGLIQNEIYPAKPKRPGIISYLSNPEVPNDNPKNLGGLEKEDIWLAENHMLVLRGGKFPDHETEESSGDLQGWLPIDDYEAPKRQVRIPSQPKVPPPFPVQLTDGGPIKILGTNERADSRENESQWIPEGLIPFNDTLDSMRDNQRNTTNRNNLPGDRKTKSGSTLGGIVGPFFPALPPGAVFVPPPNNQSDYDEDDQSIYYPPPYSFKYSQDNSTAVPPGPLVPGIILPPPPDFFSQLEEKKPTIKTHNTKCTRCTTTTLPSKSSYNSAQKSSTKSYKVVSSSTTSSTKAPYRSFTMKPIGKLKHKTVTVPFTETVNKTTVDTSPYVEITTPSSNKVNTLEISEIYTVRPVLSNQVVESRTEEQKSRWTGGPSKSRPIVAYYPTATPSIAYESVESTPATVKKFITTEKRPETLASYYFYEEANDETSGTTANPTVYFQETTPLPYYKVESQPVPKKRKPYYDIEITPSQQTAEEYSEQVPESVVKTSPRYQYSESRPSTKIPVSPRVQGQRMLSQTSPLFYQSVTERPKISLQSLFTTPTTKGFSADNPSGNRYDQEFKSKPVYQYSFEANNYSQRGRQQPIYKQEVQEQPQKQVTFNEWQDIQDEGQLYDYEGPFEPETRHQQDRTHYRTRLPDNYETSTIRPSILNTTPNPAHAYYTKQDEQLLDDVTKEYFTNFGKKIRHQGLPSTTPIYGKSTSATEKPNYLTRNSFATNDYESSQSATYKTPRVKVHYGDQSQITYSLKDDTRVNYQQPLPPINPDAEYLPEYGPNNNNPTVQVQSQSLRNPYSQPNLSRQRLLPIIRYKSQQILQQSADRTSTSFVPLTDSQDKNNQRIYPVRPISLSGDIDVNYRNPRPQINPDAELIDPVIRQAASSENPTSYFTYRLPGDSGHVYFLTPHAIAQRHENSDAYLRTQGSRPVRRRRGPGNV